MELKQLVVASNNLGKLDEFSKLFAPLGIRLFSQRELGVPETSEPFNTFVENALHKARHAARLTGLPVLADDSGLCVAALLGAPGVLSARFAGEAKSDMENNALLIQKLKQNQLRSASYYCSLVLLRYVDDPQPIIADGSWPGEIIDTPRGENGFGYDAHFYLSNYAKTAAELAPEIKNKISHRALALKSLLKKIQQADAANI